MSSSGSPTALRCVTCGERLVRGRGPGQFTHVSRLVAACDLNADHPPRPDWTGVGALTCRVCGTEVVARGDALDHTDAARDTDHPPDPALPIA
jgi:hypothetical protein